MDCKNCKIEMEDKGIDEIEEREDVEEEDGTYTYDKLISRYLGRKYKCPKCGETEIENVDR